MAKNLILKREYQALVSSSLFKVFCFVAWGLFAFALWNGVNYYQKNTEARIVAQEKTYQQWLNQEPKSPHSAAHYGFYAFKPMPLLSIMDRGMDDYLGNATWLEAHLQNEVQLRAIEDGNSLVKYDALTIGFVWQFLFPLILLILTFNVITKEKENGTMVMLLSTGVSTRYILLGKIQGILKGFLLFIFIPQVLLLSIILAINAGNIIVEDFLSYAIVIFFYLLLYYLVANISVFLSAVMRTSSQVLVISVGFWVVSAFILPRVYGTIAKQVYTTPSSFEFTEIVMNIRNNGLDGKTSYEEFNKKLEDSILRKYKVDSIQQLPVSFAGIATQAGEERDYIAYDKNYGELHQKFVSQDKLMEVGNVLSPLLAMRNLSFGLSETNIYRHLDFTNQAEKHRRMIQKVMNDHQTVHGVHTDKDGKYNADHHLWKEIPPFKYERPGLLTLIKNQFWSLFSIIIWLGLAFYLRRKAEKNLKPVG